MNKPLSQAELRKIEKAFPAAMTRAEKLERWAKMVAKAKHPIFIFHRLEYQDADYLAVAAHPESAFELAFADADLRAAGLQSNTVAESQRFFELSKAELHEFSCDCSGAISNKDMANRIRGIAGRVPSSGMNAPAVAAGLINGALMVAFGTAFYFS